MQIPYKVSILIPIYGVEKYIERCAVSLFEQTYECIEYIFVNDCTKDNSIAVLQEVIERYHLRKKQVKIINHEINKGLAGTRNTAIEAATGDFLFHVDSDDWVEKNMVEACVNKQIETNADIVSFDWETHWIGKSTFTQRIDFISPTEMAKGTLIHDFNIWARMIRRSLYIANNIRCIEGCGMGEDYAVTSRLAFYARKVTVLHEYLQHYDCTNTNSYTFNMNAERLKQLVRNYEILQKFYQDKGSEYKDYPYIIRIQALSYILRYTDNKTEFEIASKELRAIDKKYYQYLLPQIRFILLYCDNIWILQYSLKLMRKIKYLLERKVR